MLKRQQGMTMIGVLFVLALIGVIGYAGMRILPLYQNYMKVSRSMEATASEFKGDSVDQAALRRTLEKHWQIEDIDSVAVFFQAQTPVGGEADASMWHAGENLYRFGDPAREIPACTACHGPVGRGNAVADFPALRAQFADYVTKELNDFASGARYSGAKAGAPTSRNGYMMSTVAKRLNSEDIKELAAYIQGMR